MYYSDVIIIGGGFGGLNVAKKLRYSGLTVTLIDKVNYHLFQPLLYQVATAVLSPADIAVPLRYIFKGEKQIRIILGEAVKIDKQSRTVFLKEGVRLSYKNLVVAVGSRHSYFGHKNWENFAPGLKTIGDALHAREKILLAFEKAEMAESMIERQKFLTFCIVGAGPTGVEMAGAIAEIARNTLTKEFRNFDPKHSRILLIEGGDRLLPAYPPDLSRQAKQMLEKLGVEVRLNAFVTDIFPDGCQIGNERIDAATLIWAAGNAASPLIQTFAEERDKMGRAFVGSDLTLPGYPELFVIGDCAHAKDTDGTPLPGIAPVAVQQARFVAKILWNRVPPEKRSGFRYWDRGNMATIGRTKAVAVLFNLKFSGWIAWFLWSWIHILFLIHFRNKLSVMLGWIWNFLQSQRSVRLITFRDENEPKF